MRGRYLAPPDPGPLPPPDFATRHLPTETIAAGSRLTRIHRSNVGPLFFGSTGGNRFDDPARTYGVCYFATSIEGAFAETCLRAVGVRFVALTFLEERSFADIEVTSPLQVVSLHGPGLAQLGATGVVSSGPHALAQQWSQAIHDHRQAPDGITYRSNHDNGEQCVALFDRCQANLHIAGSRPIMADRAALAALLNRYNVGLG
ncbi:RES family NAD+ phosphorylase [Labrys okinawensis]|uniref:RES family NAD+ phosphorylase n=1 Tax=Labrys okinawensis TaxID=346911 RepID=UPI0039BD28CD